MHTQSSAQRNVKAIILSGEAEKTMGIMKALTEDFSEARGEIKLVRNWDVDIFTPEQLGQLLRRRNKSTAQRKLGTSSLCPIVQQKSGTSCDSSC